MTAPRIVAERLLAEPGPEFRASLAAAMLAFTDAQFGPTERAPLAIVLDHAGPEPAGLWGRTGHGFLFVEILYLPASLRGQGHGARLLEAAESEARRRACHAAWLDTMTPDAQRFYERHGYQIFGTLEDHPRGHRRVFLRKTL